MDTGTKAGRGPVAVTGAGSTSGRALSASGSGALPSAAASSLRVRGRRHEAVQPERAVQGRAPGAAAEGRLRRLHLQLLPEIQRAGVHDLHQPADRGALAAGQPGFRQGARVPVPRVRAQRRAGRRGDRRHRVPAARLLHLAGQGAGGVQQGGEPGRVARGVPRHHRLHGAGRVPQQVPEPPRRRPHDQSAGGAGRDQNHPAQHHGVAAGARGEAGRPGVQIGGAGGAVQSLLQNRSEAELVLCGDVTPPRGAPAPARQALAPPLGSRTGRGAPEAPGPPLGMSPPGHRG